jgi:hypothetical protein
MSQRPPDLGYVLPVTEADSPDRRQHANTPTHLEDVERCGDLPRGDQVMTSNIPPAAIPGPDDVPEWEQPDEQQPDPFGEPTDENGSPRPDTSDDNDHSKHDPPRGE